MATIRNNRAYTFMPMQYLHDAARRARSTSACGPQRPHSIFTFVSNEAIFRSTQEHRRKARRGQAVCRTPAAARRRLLAFGGFVLAFRSDRRICNSSPDMHLCISWWVRLEIQRFSFVTFSVLARARSWRSFHLHPNNLTGDRSKEVRGAITPGVSYKLRMTKRSAGAARSFRRCLGGAIVRVVKHIAQVPAVAGHTRKDFQLD